MVKLFRKSRLKSILSSSTAKYIIYAIGEIFLIVVGILIAFNINNWHEESIEKEEEIAILTGIRNDLLIDSIDININIDSYQSKMTSDSTFLNHLITNKPYSDTTANFLLPLYLTELLIVLHKSSFDEAKSQGLHIISNPKIRNDIQRLYEFDYRYLELIENNESSVHTKSLQNYFIGDKILSSDYSNKTKRMNLILTKETYKSLTEDKHFQMLLGLEVYSTRNTLENQYYPILEKILTLSEEIEAELKTLTH